MATADPHAVFAELESQPGARSKIGHLRSLLPLVEDALAKGVRTEVVLQALARLGLELSPSLYRSYLARLRADAASSQGAAQGAPPASPPAVAPNEPASTPASAASTRSLPSSSSAPGAVLAALGPDPHYELDRLARQYRAELGERRRREKAGKA